MRYISTRGAGAVSDARAVLLGLAPDGGLYVPAEFPEIDVRECLEQDFCGMAARLLGAFFPSLGDMKELAQKAYAGRFPAGDPTPLKKAGGLWSLELYHGPTCAFKDVALSVLPRLIPAAVRAEGCGDEIVILTATSGDTGKAALEGFRGVEGTRILVFYPAEGVSAVQKAQMATQEGSNVRVCAVEGNFDDCQRSVKEAFARFTGEELPRGVRLSSANSINIGRLVPQITYYFYAYAALLRQGAVAMGDPVDFTVPTGNFGDILAGWYARRLGLPVGKLVCASNDNRVLTDFFETGVYDRRRPFLLTHSPSMDILVSSNLERLLYHLCGDSTRVAELMRSLNEEGSYALPEALRPALAADFAAGSCDDAAALETIGRYWKDCGYLCDPHTAVALKVAEEYRRGAGDGRPMVVLSTASPFKFPAAVLQALGQSPEGEELRLAEKLAGVTGQPVPPPLAGLESRPVRHRDRVERTRLIEYTKDFLEDKS